MDLGQGQLLMVPTAASRSERGPTPAALTEGITCWLIMSIMVESLHLDGARVVVVKDVSTSLALLLGHDAIFSKSLVFFSE